MTSLICGADLNHVSNDEGHRCGHGTRNNFDVIKRPSMLLQVHDNLTIADLQDKFSMCFPGLKIEFCRKKHHWEEICPENQLWPSSTRIGQLRKIHNQGVLELKSRDKVGEAEKMFYDQFGLNVQIFYRSGERWIQTGKSDNLSIGAVQERAYKRPRMVLL